MGHKDTNGVPLATDFHTCFPDAMGLMTLTTGTNHAVSNDYEEMSFALKSTQAGYSYSHLQVAVLHLLCSKSLPVMFGTKVDDIDS